MIEHTFNEKVEIKDKIIKYDNLVELIDIFEGEKRRIIDDLKEKNINEYDEINNCKILNTEYAANVPYISYSLTLSNESSIRFTSEDIDTLKQHFKRKRVLSFSVYISITKNSSSIRAFIHHANIPQEIDITSNNDQWVFVMREKIKKWVDSLENQNRLKILDKPIVLALSGVISSILLFLIIYKITVIDMGSRYFNSLEKILYDKSDSQPTLIGFVIGLIIFIVVMRIIFKIYDILNDDWPHVEIKIGPEHEFDWINQRKKLIWYGTYLGLPILLYIFFKLIDKI
ncbi:MAG: hypothetical protein K9L19_18640 [Desulfarculaceae bacterium]|nr:hypothetical protein [Desulfarculaceae bacterium]MCF8122679.1 hypothetical protein [Desulfarculaceae bacterium]